MNRYLDGTRFRAERKGRWVKVGFSDLTEQEMDEMLVGRSREWLCQLCKTLALTLKEIGDEYDIYNYREYGND